MNKKTLVFFFVYCLTVAALFAQKDPKAEAMLNTMSDKYKAYKSFQADFAYTIESPQEKIKENMNGTITVKSNKFKLRLGEQEIYNNGTTVWNYLKDDNEVTITTYSPENGDINPAEIYNIYKKGYKYGFAEDAEEAKTHDVIDLTPENRNQSIFKVRLVLDKKTKELKSWKIFEKNGRRFVYNISKFVPNVNVKDADFNFDKAKYPGVSEISLK